MSDTSRRAPGDVEGGATSLDIAAALAAELAAESLAASTRRAYAASRRTWETWCAAAGLESWPAVPATVGTWIAALVAEGRAIVTIERHLSALTDAHRRHTWPLLQDEPEIRAVLRGARRRVGRERTPKAALTLAELDLLLAGLDEDLAGVRNRALLLVGFGAALRRSELVALDVRDVTVEGEGLRLRIRGSKMDQEREGVTLGIPRGMRGRCAATAVQRWLELADYDEGPLFRAVNRWGTIAEGRMSDRAVARLVQTLAERAGLDPTRFAGHSLRSGFATAAGRAGASERSIARQTRHRSLATLRRYIHEGEAFIAVPRLL